MIALIASALLGTSPLQTLPPGSNVYRLRIGTYRTGSSLQKSATALLILPNPIILTPQDPRILFDQPAECSLSFQGLFETCSSVEFVAEFSDFPEIDGSITGISGRKLWAAFAPEALTIRGTVSLYDHSLPSEFYGSLGFFQSQIPEPKSWTMLLAGFGAIGWRLRAAIKQPFKAVLQD